MEPVLGLHWPEFDECYSMTYDTNASELQSWVESANDRRTHFPIQNLPFGRFRKAQNGPLHIGVAIGDMVLDLEQAGLIATSDMAYVLSLPLAQRRGLRETLSKGLRRGSPMQAAWESALSPISDVILDLPCDVRNYTDFFVGIHHARATGKLLRPNTPLLPNYKWVPIGYHGRASTICASGHHFRRPRGQFRKKDEASPQYRATEKLDFELEIGIVVGCSNEHGQPISIDHAEQHVFGLTLLNDWSARDIQAWEAQPLGPFLAKSFATTLSPWIVPVEALEPFRRPCSRPASDPAPLPYLSSRDNDLRGAVDVKLEVVLQTAKMQASGHAGDVIATSNFADAAYWTMAQIVAHHSSNGCHLLAGDLLGTGTLSGPEREEAGCLLEMTLGGQQSISLSNGEARTFLEDGDTIVLRGFCEAPGYRRIGFGECKATIVEGD